jgi:hypothetical protein
MLPKLGTPLLIKVLEYFPAIAFALIMHVYGEIHGRIKPLFDDSERHRVEFGTAQV